MSAQHPFSPAALRQLDVAARVSACLSLVGSSWTIISYLMYPPLRKPVNRFSFCISITNSVACLAYAWGRYPVAAGRETAFCQTQGFIITWFVMTDPLLVTVMALNVYLTIRRKRSLKELKKSDLVGMGLAFFLPFPSALTFLLWRPNGKTVYGDATTWCWISRESGLLRLVAFYIPIWISILTSLSLFALSGKSILRVRQRLKAVKSKSPLNHRFSGEHVYIDEYRGDGGPELSTPSDQERPSQVVFHEPDFSDDQNSKDLQPLAPTYSRDLAVSRSSSNQTTVGLNRERTFSTTSQTPLRRTPSRFDAVHWKYAQFAFLYTIVLLITWVPISINRVYNTFIAPNNQIYSLYLASAICIPFHGLGNSIIYTVTSWTECVQFVTCSTPRRPSITSDTSFGLGGLFRGWVGQSSSWYRTFLSYTVVTDQGQMDEMDSHEALSTASSAHIAHLLTYYVGCGLYLVVVFNQYSLKPTVWNHPEPDSQSGETFGLRTAA